MKTSYKMLAVASAGYIFAAAGSAQAAVTVDSYSLDTGSFGTGLGVHATGGKQTGPTVNGVVNIDGSAVTFSSTDDLSMTGSGEATVYPIGDFITNLDVIFAKAWDSITFSFAGDDGTFSLLVNGSSLFTGPGCTICTIDDTGQNKFTLSGGGITSLAFTFDPGVATAKQFRVEGLTSAVPEPATWALLLIGFAGIGSTLRRRKASTQRLRVTYG